MIWANLLHLSYNMWEDRIASETPIRGDRPFLRFDEKLWNDLLEKMVEVGMNMVVIDLGDGVNYESHPEIAVENAWSRDKLRQELDKIRGMGLEPIPKLNFSAAHDSWLGIYHRCVSTPKYYEVCANLVTEAIELFDGPRFFHLGYDEETAWHQMHYQYVVIRQYDLWWHDFNFFVEAVEKHNVRPWIWSDYIWKHRDDFIEKMPKSVLQSNWYYGNQFDKYDAFEESDDEVQRYIEAYTDLEEYGFDQIPTGSNFGCDENFGMTVDFCRKNISPERLKGFMQTPWHPTLEEFRDKHLKAIELVATEIEKWQ